MYVVYNINSGLPAVKDFFSAPERGRRGEDSERFQIRDEIQLNYFLSYVSFGIMGMVKEWAGQGMTLPKEKLIAYADDLVDRSAQAIF